MEKILLIPEQQVVAKNPVAKAVVLDWLEICFIQKPGSKKVETKSEFDTHQSNELNLRNNKEVFISKFFDDSEPLVKRGNFQARLTGDKTRFWGTVHEIFYDGMKFGTLCSNPHNPKIKQPNEIFFKLENDWNYQKEWFSALQDFADTFELTLSHLNRIDVAADDFNFLEPVKLFHRGLIEKKGRSAYNLRGKGNEEPNGFNLGSMNSGKYVRVYDKYKEIEKNSKKYYIYDFWNLNGIDSTDFHKMQRLEVTIRTKIIKEFIGELSWSKMKLFQNAEKLSSILQSAINNVYEWRVKRTNEKTNVTRLEKICTIVWGCSVNLLQRVKVFSSKKIRSFQTTAKMAYQLYLKTGLGQYAGMAYEIIENCNLQNWFDKKRGWWEYEYSLETSKRNEFLPLFNYKTGQKTDAVLGNLKGMQRKVYGV